MRAHLGSTAALSKVAFRWHVSLMSAAALALLRPSHAIAVDLVPLEIQPVSVELLIEVSNAPDLVAPAGVASASLSESFSNSTGSEGQVVASVTTVTDRIRVEFGGSWRCT